MNGTLVNWALGLAFALVPFFTYFVSGDFGRVSKDNLTSYVLLLLIPVMTKNHKLPKFIPIIAVITCCMIFLNQKSPNSFNGILQIFYIYIAIVFFICFLQSYEKSSLYIILNFAVAGSVIQSLIVILSHFDIPVYYKILKIFEPRLLQHGVFKGIGTLGSTNLLGCYLAVTAPAFLRGNLKYLLIFPICALSMAGSTMGWLAFIGGLAYFYLQWFLERSFFYSCFIMFGLVAFMSIEGYDSNRFDAWVRIIDSFTISEFFTGKGVSFLFDNPILLKDGSYMKQEHNSYLSILTTCGVIPLLALFYFFKLDCKGISNNIFSSILFSFAVSFYGHFTLHQSTVLILFLVSLAVCIKESYELERC